MAFFAVLLVLATPFIEIALFIKVGQWIGVLPTIGLTLLSTMAGLAIVRAQGLSNLMAIQRAMGRQELPFGGVIHAVFIALAGFLLALPGFFTDGIGLLLLIPPVRTWLGRLMVSRLQFTVQAGAHRQDFTGASPTVVDGEFWEEENMSAQRRGPDPLPPPLPPKAND